MNRKAGVLAKCLWTGLLLAALVRPAQAVDGKANGIDFRDQRMMSSATFLNGHPDLKHRTDGWQAYSSGDYIVALEQFKVAARYADKLSQAMIAEMLWQGRGTSMDRAMAYAWADLAAERGYAQFRRLREQYWRQLGEAERARAMQAGPALLLEYGDAAAKPRMAEFLVKAKRLMRSGVHVRRPKEVWVPDGDGLPMRIDGNRFYDPRFWDPVRYQAWQDAIWTDPPAGEVDVGAVEQVRATGQ